MNQIDYPGYKEANALICEKLGVKGQLLADEYFELLSQDMSFIDWERTGEGFEHVLRKAKQIVRLQNKQAFDRGDARTKGSKQASISTRATGQGSTNPVDDLVELLLGQLLPLYQGHRYMGHHFQKFGDVPERYGMELWHDPDDASVLLFGRGKGTGLYYWNLYVMRWEPDDDAPLGTQKIKMSVSPHTTPEELKRAYTALQEAIGITRPKSKNIGWFLAAAAWHQSILDGRELTIEALRDVLVRHGENPDDLKTLDTPSEARRRMRRVLQSTLYPDNWSREWQVVSSTTHGAHRVKPVTKSRKRLRRT